MGRMTVLPESHEVLVGRDVAMSVPEKHYVSGHRLVPPFPQGTDVIFLGLGCFWGAERKFWQQEGVYSTAVGYAGGTTPNPSYEEVCSGLTGHSEVVMVVYDDSQENLRELLKVFWESHDPTQGMKQGNDVGTQYRSCIYTHTPLQLQMAEDTLALYQAKLAAEGFPPVTTEIKTDQRFFYAEEYHQQYLAKNPGGYCGLGGTGVCLT